MGQKYAEAYSTYPDTELVAIAEFNEKRRGEMGARFGVTALYPDAAALFKEILPDIAVTVLPVQYNTEAVLAAVEAGVKAIQTEKPLAARLSDADAMVEACEANGVLFAGGNLQRAMNEVQEAAGWIRSGRFGELTGASVHGWGNQVSGGGCQHISVLRLFTGAEIEGTGYAATERGLDHPRPGRQTDEINIIARKAFIKRQGQVRLAAEVSKLRRILQRLFDVLDFNVAECTRKLQGLVERPCPVGIQPNRCLSGQYACQLTNLRSVRIRGLLPHLDLDARVPMLKAGL